MKVIITGYPRTGKTTLAQSYPERLVRHTDDTKHLPWSEASEEVARWLNEDGPWVIEGVAAPRALRKWMKANRGKPCDRVIFLREFRVPVTNNQTTMAKGTETVWQKILPDLLSRGVLVED